MIHHALALLKSDLEAYIKGLDPTSTADFVEVGNIATVDIGSQDSSTLDARIVISLVNIEEESAFKNLSNATKIPNGSVRYQNAPVFLNLYLLFTANFKDYGNALIYLSAVIQFFQGKHVFNLKNTPEFGSNATDEAPDADLLEMQLVLDLYTMTFEQINHLWGSLGGKQMPFVMYKARLVKLLDRRPTGTGPLIEEIGVNGRGMAPQA